MSTAPPSQEPDHSTTIGELREQLGRHFAKPHQSSETLGMLLVHAGVNTLAEYLERHPIT